MTLTDIAERAKASTEAEARARVTWAQLQELAMAANVARKAYYGHSRALGTSDEIDVEFDLEEWRLMKAEILAHDAYQSALKRYQEQQS